MTVFSSYFSQGKELINKSTDDLGSLIENESNKEEISELIYHRFYERFLKIFFYDSTNKTEYQNSGVKEVNNAFHFEYKNGFLMMSSSCLLIESIASFISGNDKTLGNGNENYIVVFLKCEEYNNDLKIFKNQNIYKSIRNGLLHQGEIYDNYKIRRDGKLFDEQKRTINATKFVLSLKSFLESYRNDLNDSNWDSEIWDNCRRKIRFIVKNAT